MPNYVKTVMTIAGDNAEQIINDITFIDEDNNRKVNFELIKKMPEILENTSASNNQGMYAILAGLERARYSEDRLKLGKQLMKYSEKEREQMLKRLECFFRCGYLDWYDWRLENWGTKWNADNCTFDGNSISFWTAWSFPAEIVATLSKKYADVRFECFYADEDMSYNCGHVTFQNGLIVFEIFQKVEVLRQKKSTLMYGTIGICTKRVMTDIGN